MNSATCKNIDLLLQQIKTYSAADDPKAVSLIYSHFFHKLVFFAASFVKSREAAEEVVEDVIIKLWSNKKTIASIQNLQVYLFSAVRNQSLNYLEKKPLYAVSELSQNSYSIESSSVSPLEHLILSEMTQELQVAVDSLPHRCQLIFRLVREEGLKYKEGAEILNISVNTIDNQMAIAVRRICASLQLKKSEPALRKS